jgi:hypothetical protein
MECSFLVVTVPSAQVGAKIKMVVIVLVKDGALVMRLEYTVEHLASGGVSNSMPANNTGSEAF